MWPRDRIEEGEGPQRTRCWQCGATFWTEGAPFCRETCRVMYDIENPEEDGSAVDWGEYGGEA